MSQLALGMFPRLQASAGSIEVATSPGAGGDKTAVPLSPAGKSFGSHNGLGRAGSMPSSESSGTAEAALLEAWRSRQLSTDSAADEVELGPMIGRGGCASFSPLLGFALQIGP